MILILHPRERAPEVCRYFRDYMRAAPREVGAGLILMRAPPAPFVPPGLPGRPAIARYLGSMEQGAEILAPLREFGDPLVDLVKPMPYVEFQALTDAGNPPGRRSYYWRSEMLPDLPDEAIDALIACAATASSPASVLVMSPVGGADRTMQFPSEAARRGGCTTATASGPDDQRRIAWVRTTESALRPWTMAGVALNLVSDVDTPG